MTNTPTLTLPVVPKRWTLESTITFAGAVALFALGVLAEAHVVLPKGAAPDVRAVIAAASTITGVLTALAGLLSRHSITKASIRAGTDV